MTDAVFNYAVWAALYPSLAVTVSEPLATGYFGQAALILDNSACSVVSDVSTRLALFNLLVAHIAILNGPTRDNGGLVGRIDQASEGSVSVHTAYDNPSNASWFVQTGPGAQFWQATASYRSARYVPGPQRFMSPGPPYGIAYGNPWNRGGL